MVGNPSNAPGYGDPFQAGLPVSFTIRDLSVDAVIRTFAPSVVSMSLSDEHYRVNWDTKADGLNAAHTYRIEAWIGSERIAFADVDVVSTGSQLKSVQTSEYIPLLDGRTLPIKIRVEQGWNCKNNASCGTQVVGNTPPAGQTYTIVTTNDGENAVAFPANWFDPAKAPNGVIVTIEDVTAQLSPVEDRPRCSLGRTLMVTQDQCIRIKTDPVVTVTNTVVVGKCLTNTTDSRVQLLKISEGEDAHVTFLRNVPPPITCPERVGMNPFSNPVARYAYAAVTRIGRSVQRVLAPKSAFALDLGVGGALSPGDGFSIITSGVPLAMSMVAGNGETAPIGSATNVAPRIQLRALHRPSVDLPAGPNDAVVTCTVMAGGGQIGGGPTALAVHNPEEDPDGVYTCPAWTLGAGTNTVKVSAAKVDDFVRLGGVETPFMGSVTFTAYGLPSPVLAFKGIEEDVVNDVTVGRFQLTVTNRAQYPNSLFAASPNLPPCGLNTSASRTWVDIFSGGGARIYGFCALGSSADLDGIWYAISEGPTPASVYVTLTDRQNKHVYTSNTVAIPPRQLAPADRSVFSYTPNVGRPTTLSWRAVAGAATYEIERAYCESWSLPDYAATCTKWTEYPVATTTATSFDFLFVGAQPGRWRVRARFPDNSVGPWSTYRYFLYTS
jgi:hypothetical protein